MGKNFVKHMKVEGWYLDTFPQELAYCEKNKSKGANKGHKTVWVLRELTDGAWGRYMDYLRKESRTNYGLTLIHQGYLDLRDEALAGCEPAELDDFKEFVQQQIKVGAVPGSKVRRYLKLKWEDFSDPQAKRVEMDLVPVEPW